MPARLAPEYAGWLYLASILDVYSRLVVGWAMRAHMKAELALAALDMAVKRRNPIGHLVHHSDRGSQYASQAYRDTLDQRNILCSMSAKGDCYDNAPKESFFHTLKVELIHGRRFTTRREAKAAVFEYIEAFYNRRRLHSSLGYLTPQEFELVEAA